MSYYLLQAVYRSEQWKSVIADPKNREAESRKVYEAFGGTLHGAYFAFGDCAIFAICEFPDNETAAAASIAQNATLNTAEWKTIPLIPISEMVEVFRRAGTTETSYVPPVDYG